MAMRYVHQTAVHKWHDAEDWLYLLKLNSEFLQLCLDGHKDISTPYQVGPLDSDDVLLIPSSIELQKWRLLVTANKVAFITEPERITEYGIWSQVEQLPYLDFLVLYQGDNSDNF